MVIKNIIAGGKTVLNLTVDTLKNNKDEDSKKNWIS